MKKIARSLLLNVCILFPLLAEAKPDLPPKLVAFIEKVKSEKDDLQGGAIAILYKGKVVYSTTFGHPKGSEGIITSKTLFPLASVSKAVAALGIALLVEEGPLRFEETVKLPYLKNPVSLNHVMGHTTGYHFKGNAPIEQGLARPQILEKLKAEKPKCQPGGCYFYSNLVYGLVEEVMNKKNLHLEDAIQKLRSTLKTDEIQILPLKGGTDVAYPHVKVGETLKPKGLPPYYPKATPAAAGVFASLDAMIQVLQLASGYKPELASTQTFSPLFQPMIANRDIHKWNMKEIKNIQDIDSYYGLGWRILRNKKYPEKELIFHPGYLAGVRSFVGFIPSEEIGIILLVNQDTPWATRSGIAFWDGLLK